MATASARSRGATLQFSSKIKLLSLMPKDGNRLSEKIMLKQGDL
jgi:hypothetical protein